LAPTEDVFTFLRYLALVEPQEATPVFSRLRASEDYNLIVTARDAPEIPAALAARSYVISLGVWGRGSAPSQRGEAPPLHPLVTKKAPPDL
jgi:hypothetical protein